MGITVNKVVVVGGRAGFCKKSRAGMAKILQIILVQTSRNITVT